MSGDISDRVLTRVRERYETQKDLLIYDSGHTIEAKDCADAWTRINQFGLQAHQLKLYRDSNRHVIPRISVTIQNWGNLIPMEQFGYRRTLRLNRLERNYCNLESLGTCRRFFETKSPNKTSTHGLIFGTGKKKTPPCLVGATFVYLPGRLLPSFYLRASELIKTLGADLHFFDRILRGDASRGLSGAVPEWMANSMGPVTIHLDMGYSLAQFFPLFEIIQPGYPLNPEHRFHNLCLKALHKAFFTEEESKWRPERRMQRNVRKVISKYKTNSEGRVVYGPGFFAGQKEYVRKVKRRSSSND